MAEWIGADGLVRERLQCRPAPARAASIGLLSGQGNPEWSSERLPKRLGVDWSAGADRHRKERGDLAIRHIAISCATVETKGEAI